MTHLRKLKLDCSGQGLENRSQNVINDKECVFLYAFEKTQKTSGWLFFSIINSKTAGTKYKKKRYINTPHERTTKYTVYSQEK